MSDTITFENAKVTLPCGPWQETHEFTGEVRRAAAGEDVLLDYGSVYRYGTRSVNVRPILRRKPPAIWQPPEYARGTGWTVEPTHFVDGPGWIINAPRMKTLLSNGFGKINPILAAVGWTIPPERKVWVC